jgi:hypothetical protein
VGRVAKQDSDVPPDISMLTPELCATRLCRRSISIFSSDTRQSCDGESGTARQHDPFAVPYYEDKFILTPNYHVFEMYMPHGGATAVRTEFISPKVGFTRLDAPEERSAGEFLGVGWSASINGKTVTLTAVNPDAKNARETEINTTEHA